MKVLLGQAGIHFSVGFLRQITSMITLSFAAIFGFLVSWGCAAGYLVIIGGVAGLRNVRKNMLKT